MKFPQEVSTFRGRKWDLLSVWYVVASPDIDMVDGWYWAVTLYGSTYTGIHQHDLIPLSDLTPVYPTETWNKISLSE